MTASSNKAMGPAGRREPNSMRKWNEYAVVTALRRHGPQRVSELVAATGLTVATLGVVLRDLESKGWVDVGEPVTGGMGRPAQVFSLRVPKGSVIGLDVGAHAVRCVRLDLAGNDRARAELRLPSGASEQQRLEAVAAVVTEGCTDADGPVWLTGLAVGGLLDVDGRMLESVAVPEWNGLNPGEQLAGALPGRALVINDVRAACLAEHELGAAREHDEVLLIQLGRRPTLGLLWEGRLRHGAHGTAGDMSRNFSFPAEERMAWLDRFRDSNDPLGAAVRAAVDGDAAALEGARHYVERLTPALVIATAVVDPAIVVIGGALSPLADHLIDDVAAAVAAGVSRPPLVVASELDQYAMALGAGMLAIRRLGEALASPTGGVAPFTPDEFERLPLKGGLDETRW